MSTDETLNKAVGQAYVILELAQKNFYKLLRDYLANKDIALPEESKEEVNKIFADTVKTYLLAEMPTLLSFVLYHRLNNDDILTKFTPEFLDACEAQMGNVSVALAKKTEELPAIAKGFLDSR